MKNTISIVILLFLSAISFGQEIPGVTLSNKTTTKYSEDSDISVRYIKLTNDIKNDVAVLINGKFFKNGYSLLKTVNPNKIKAVNIEKEDITFDGTKYSAQLLISMNSDYTPDVISLNNLLTKHLTLDSIPTILKIDNAYVNQDFNEYLVDEKYILQIDISKVNTSVGEKINLINLITKSDKNIEKANQPKQIILRGTN